jgi:hypothetical protein
MKANVLGLGRIAVAGTVLLSATVAWGAPGGRVRLGERLTSPDVVQRAPRGETFSLSTQFTGVLGKTIRIGTAEYRVSPRATIYVVGKGVVEHGFAVYDAYLYISGRRVGNEATVTQIMVRIKDPRSWGDKGDVGLLPPGAPN